MSAPTRRCTKCSRTYPPGSERFCPHCGGVLEEVAPPAVKGSREGQVLDGRYVLERPLGEGGMGLVYLARHQRLERKFAIKLLHYEFLRDARVRLRFLREARATCALDHPSAVRLYDYGTTEQGEPYLVMEYLPGESLYRVLTDSPERRLPVSQAVDVTLGVVRVLAQAHALRIVHRDVKPENILLIERNNVPDWPVLLDFGVASILDQPPLTRIGQEIIGTPHYMAPDLLSSAAAPPADLYAVGILLHDLLAGGPPFEGELNQLLVHHLSTVPPLLSDRGAQHIPALDRLVARLLDKDPARRPTAAETEEALQEIRAKLPSRSVQGLLLAKTLILQRAQSAGVAAALPSALASSMVLPGQSGVPAQDRATMLLPSFLRQVDDVEQNIERLGGALSTRLGPLGDRVWGSWPAEAGALRVQLGDSERLLDGAGMDLALAQNLLHEEEAGVHAIQEERRRRIVDLIDRLQSETGLSAVERRSLEDRRALEEQALHQPAPVNGELTQRRDALEGRIQQLRAHLRQVLVQLGNQLLRATWPRPLKEERRRLEEELTQFESALGMEAFLLRAVPAG